MNMMSLQDHQEDQAVPDFVRQIRAADALEGTEFESASASPSANTLLERLPWFRNLPLAGKINAVFGTFLAVGALMVMVLGFGLVSAGLWRKLAALRHAGFALLAREQQRFVEAAPRRRRDLHRSGRKVDPHDDALGAPWHGEYGQGETVQHLRVPDFSG